MKAEVLLVSDPWAIQRANAYGGPQIKFINDQIGHGLFADQTYRRGELIALYDGEMRFGKEAEQTSGPYVIFGKHGRKTFAIDGEKFFRASHKGRFINEAHTQGQYANVVEKFNPETMTIEFYVSAAGAAVIHEGEEIIWDYGPQYERNYPKIKRVF